MLLNVWTIGSVTLSHFMILAIVNGIPKWCTSSATLLLWHSLVGHFPDQHSRTPHWEPAGTDGFMRANAATLYLSMTFADIWLWWTSLLPSTVKLFPIKICWTKHEKFRSLFWSWWITSLPTLQPSNPSNFWPMIPPFQRLELPMAPPTVDTVPGPKALHAKESLGPSRPLRFWPGSREALNQLQSFFQPCWHKNITFSHTKITT